MTKEDERTDTEARRLKTIKDSADYKDSRDTQTCNEWRSRRIDPSARDFKMKCGKPSIVS